MDLAAHLAENVSKVMLARDPGFAESGISADSIGPGRAVLSCSVTPEMMNALGLCSGAAIFALAERAFLLAANSHNQRAVSQSASIHHLAPAHEGDRLVARAREISRSGRSGLYEVEITRENGPVIAVFQGQARAVRGTWVQAFAP